MPVLSRRLTLYLKIFAVLLISGIGILLYLLFLKPVDESEKTFTSPHGTVTYKEKGGVGPQTSREILLDPTLVKADFTSDTQSRTFIIEQSRESGTIFIDNECQLSPVVTRIPKGQKIKFFNEGSLPQTVFIRSSSYTIQPQQDFTTPESFTTPDIMLIGCKSPTNIQGYLYLSP